jgi:glucan phosphorylase
MTLFCRHHELVQSPAQKKSVIHEMFKEKKKKTEETPVRNVSNPLTQIYWTRQAYRWLCIQMTKQRHY